MLLITGQTDRSKTEDLRIEPRHGELIAVCVHKLAPLDADEAAVVGKYASVPSG